MKRIIFEHPDGTIEVTEARGPNRHGQTEDQYLAQVAAITKAKTPWLSDAIHKGNRDPSEFPSDRFLRPAWRDNGGPAIDIDMPAARKFHADQILHARDFALAELTHREEEDRAHGDSAAAAQKAGLITAMKAVNINALGTQIAAAASPQALQAIWPDAIPRPGRPQ